MQWISGYNSKVQNFSHMICLAIEKIALTMLVARAINESIPLYVSQIYSTICLIKATVPSIPRTLVSKQ